MEGCSVSNHLNPDFHLTMNFSTTRMHHQPFSLGLWLDGYSDAHKFYAKFTPTAAANANQVNPTCGGPEIALVSAWSLGSVCRWAGHNSPNQVALGVNAGFSEDMLEMRTCCMDTDPEFSRNA